jgi:hypothetical protein
MSAVKPQLENYRREGPPMSGPWAQTADSYNPVYQDGTGKFGSCTATGGQIRINNCNYQGYGAIPLAVDQGGACVCVHPSGLYGCFDNPYEKCLS